jgi:hypothetical protein
MPAPTTAMSVRACMGQPTSLVGASEHVGGRLGGSVVTVSIVPGRTHDR